MYPNVEKPSYGAFVMQQSEELKRQGHHVEVIQTLGYRSRLNYLKTLFDVFLKTWNGDYDIVHAHTGLSGFTALFRWRTPLVITLHGSEVLVIKLQLLITKFACRFADAIIAVSSKIASIIPGEIIPCGVDLEIFKPHNLVEARQRLGLPMNNRLVLFPFDPKRTVKRYDIAKAVIDKLRLKRFDVELLVVSGVKNDDMPWYYNAADAMILCSDSEGSPTSVKEALACNTPVVSIDVGDVREIMEGIEGVRICDRSVEALAAGLEQVFLQAENCKFDGRTSMQRYDQSLTVKSIIKVYESVLRKRNL